MIVLDTNVVSALIGEAPDAKVASWLDRQRRESIWTTSVTVFEIRFGLELLKRSRRRELLEQAFERMMAVRLEERVIDFDPAAAVEAAVRSVQAR